jgi:hypothetical protein
VPAHIRIDFAKPPAAGAWKATIRVERQGKNEEDARKRSLASGRMQPSNRRRGSSLRESVRQHFDGR